MNGMEKNQKLEILEKAKWWWHEELVKRHEENTLKLTRVEEFSINPFLWFYLANYFEGNHKAETLAKVLVYPRVLGYSITTSFGTSFQKLITTIFGSVSGSQVSGMDIEFVDQLDGRRKYCQLKAGPNIVNKDDVKTISDHFKSAQRLARTNNLDVKLSDYMFCLLYGEERQKNSFIRKIEEDYTVTIGQEFWHRFTGDENFYKDLVDAIAETANEYNMKRKINKVVSELAKDIRKHYPDLV